MSSGTQENKNDAPELIVTNVPLIVVDPPSAILPLNGGVCTLMLINMSAIRLAFKMRSSNNDNYRLRPVYGFIEAVSMTPLQIIRLSGPTGADRLVAQYKQASVDAKDAQLLFKTGKPFGEVIIHLTAQ